MQLINSYGEESTTIHLYSLRLERRKQHKDRIMHLMYYLDGNGKRVYTLKVSALRQVTRNHTFVYQN
jgi:hypothetical protein